MSFYDGWSFQSHIAISVGFRGGRAGSAPLPLGERLTQSLTVMSDNAKF